MYKGERMKELINKIRQNKLVTLLIIIMIISIILGILFPAIITKEDKNLIIDSVKTFISGIKQNNINYLSGLLQSISNNSLVTILVWILGISIIGIPLILLIIFFKGFLVGFSFTSILITYGISGIIKAIIYTLPNIGNLLATFLLGYYAITFSIMIFKNIFKKENRNWQPIVKRYIKIGLFFLIFSILISLVECFLIPKILYFI